MKRATITIGIIILLALMLLWGYLLVFGTPKSVDGLFVELGLRDGPTAIDPAPIAPPDDRQLAPLSADLNRLTMKAVAGFVALPPAAASSSEQVVTLTPPLGRVFYAERGTGHIYELDLDTGQEERLSGTTVGQTVAAHFSPGGEAVVLVAEDGDTTRAMLYALGSANTKETELPPGSRNIQFVSDQTLRYSVIESGSTAAYEYDRDDASAVLLWRVPLIDIDIAWTSEGTYAINRTAPYLRGGVYQVISGRLRQVVAPKPTLSAIIDETGRLVFYSAFDSETGRMVSKVLDRDSGQETLSAQSFIPGKCRRIDANLWCASSYLLSLGDREALNAWYRGELVSDDQLWQGAMADDNAVLIASFSDLAGVDIDVTNLTANANETALLFLNKINDTLWLYRLPTISASDGGEARTPGQ